MGDERFKMTGMVSVMVHGQFLLRFMERQEGGFDLRVQTQIGNELHPVAVFVGQAPEEPGVKEHELVMFAVIKTWYEKLAAEMYDKYGDNLTGSTQVDLGDGSTGLIGSGGAKA